MSGEVARAARVTGDMPHSADAGGSQANHRIATLLPGLPRNDASLFVPESVWSGLGTRISALQVGPGGQARVYPRNTRAHYHAALLCLTVLQTDTRIGALSSGAAVLASPQLVVQWLVEAPVRPDLTRGRTIRRRIRCEFSSHTATL